MIVSYRNCKAEYVRIRLIDIDYLFQERTSEGTLKNDVNNLKRSKIRTIAWIMGGIVVLSFIAGIMVDVDHPLAWILGFHNDRFLHPYFATAGLGFIGAGFILVIACFCRYLQLRFLRK